MKSKRARYMTSDQPPSGLHSLKDMMLWPCRVLTGLRQAGEVDAELELRLQMLYLGKVWFITDYSGWDCPRWAMYSMGLALISDWGWSEDMVRKAIRFERACDFGDVQYELLCKVATDLDDGKSCCFHNMMDRLPTRARNFIDSALPDGEDTLQAKIIAHDFIYDWLESNRQWVFPISATSPCGVHGKRCSVHPFHDLPPDIAASSDRPTIFTVAGVTCHAWSAEGSNEGDAHHSAVFNAIWQVERVARAENGEEDGAFFECTERYPIFDKIAVKITRTHFVVWVYVNPLNQGFPSRRSRVLAFMGSRLTLRWVGPTSPEDIQLDFDRRFGRIADVSGSIFFCASDAERWFSFCFVLFLMPG